MEALGLSGGASLVNFSIWHLFVNADVIGKAVLVMLVLASFWCWAIIFEKWLRLRRLNRQADNFEDTFWSGGSLDDLYDQIGRAHV